MAVAALAIAVSYGLMSFGEGKQSSDSQTGYFYEYTSSSTDREDIENINNYQRSSVSCEGDEHVCGVLLPTDNGLGNPPLQTEFDPLVDDLWNSEQSGSATHPQVIMKD